MTLRPIDIAGGGLAGLSLGIALRRHGVPVTIHEAGDYPRHRVCGEFIAGLGRDTIARLDLAEPLHDALQHRRVAWHLGSHPPLRYGLPTPALGIGRHALDARLAARFLAAGGELRTRARLAEPASQPGMVWAAGRRRAAQPRWLGLKVHVRGLGRLRDLEMHLGSESYVGLAPIDPETVNVCGLFRLRPLAAPAPHLLLAYLEAAGLGPLAERLRTGEIVPGSPCAVAALDYGPAPASDGVVRLGDAAATIPPFTGNGMAMAFQGAETALAPLLAYAQGEIDWAATCRATNAALRGRFRLRLASARALHSFLLRPRRQRWFATLSRCRLLPFRPLYATLH